MNDADFDVLDANIEAELSHWKSDLAPRQEPIEYSFYSLALTVGLILGIVCFATLGLAISSVITSAESAGPVAYASFLPIAIISGVFDPTFSGLPQWLSRLVAAFPVKALAQLMQGGYTVRPFPAWDLANLALWTALGAGFVAWRFRWQT